jgi:hypothetical protein
LIVVDASVMVFALSSPTTQGAAARSAYLAIAAEYGARLVTFDARLAKAAEQVAPFVSVLKL